MILLFSQTATFANPEVYNSEANLSNLSVKQVLESTWVWALVGCVVVIAISALMAAKTKQRHEAH